MKKKPTQKRSKPSTKIVDVASKAIDPIDLSTRGRLEEAIEVKNLVMTALKHAEPNEVPKLIDSFARASAEIRQLEKARKKEVASFTDDEIVEYVRGMPERRRDAVVVSIQGTSLAGKPLFG